LLVALIGACMAPTGQPAAIPDGAVAQDVATAQPDPARLDGPPASSPDRAPPSGGAACPLTRDSGSGKILDAERARFARTAGPIEVLILAVGGAVHGPLPPCDRQCPERESIFAGWAAENLASQRCVRELIAAVGGSSDPTSSWLINSFGAALTWNQIQSVATHPQVLRIEAQHTMIPPP
jgi:hypothetical protein